MLQNFPSLTENSFLGQRGNLINIQLKPDARPKFFKARRVPHGFADLVHGALSDMVHNKMLKPVEPSD